ncbi:Glutathione S-transferase [Sphingomonas sp. EC-HK361]|uniref:glutathione S-transferase family protein n=1 Tax=Sphingomonas sp. EC-HK361 TaxID=2038397 RepID=UPI00125972BF|nr:glutathione S-transferase family protein [Sphingomonas sp. EC-HK361]VVT00264.1 Glutathione S-transferase [Sphingomonas sp. EC-HK361]
MILYGSSVSPFVRKVLVVAREKGIDLELRPAGMGRGGPEFDEASPFRKMPALRDPGADHGRDFLLCDSTAIVTYLEAKFPEPAMIPAEPMARARTIWFEEFGDTIVAATGGRIVFNRLVAPKVLKIAGDEAVAAKAHVEEVPPLLDYLEGVARPGGFLVGDALTVADIAVASPFATMAHAGVTIDAARWPNAAGYIAAILARPSFADLIAVEQRMMAAMA